MIRIPMTIVHITRVLLVCAACVLVASCSLFSGYGNDKAWTTWVDSLGNSLDKIDSATAIVALENARTYSHTEKQGNILNAYDAVLDCSDPDIIDSYICEFADAEYYETPEPNSIECIEAGLLTRLYEKSALVYDAMSDMESAISMQGRAVDVARRTDLWNDFFRTESRLLWMYERAGDYDASIRGYLTLLSQCHANAQRDRESEVLYRLCLLFLSMGDVSTAHIYLDEMESVHVTPTPVSDCKYWLAMSCISRAGYDSASYARSVEALNSLKHEYPAVEQVYGTTIACITADYYMNNGKVEAARHTINSALALNARSVRGKLSQTYLKILEAKMFVREGRLDEAGEFLRSINVGYLRKRDINMYDSYTEAASEYYAAIGENKRAYECIKDKDHLLDSLRIEVKTSGLAFKTLVNRRDTTIVFNAKIIDKAVNKVEGVIFRQYLWMAFAVISIAMAIATYYFISFRRIKRRHAEQESRRHVLAEEVKRRRDVILEHKNQLESKNQSIQSELYFAKNVQLNILSREAILSAKGVDEHFLFYRPCYQVSGDFYWFHDNGDKLFICAADATGHGIPGALISMVASSILTDIASTKQGLTPAVLLEELSVNLSSVLRNNNDIANADSVDMSVLCIDRVKKEVTISLARHVAYIVKSDGTSELVQGTKRCVGEVIEVEGGRPFTDIKLDVENGDCVYLASDGFVSQFGGPNNQKFKRKRFETLLSDVHALAADKQKEIIEQTFDEWKGNCDQTDDILVIGIRIGGLS